MQTNNKLRDALTKILHLTNSLDEDCAVDPVEIRDIAKAALAEPVKNCEVGNAKEQLARFIAFCKGQRLHSSGHADTCNPKCPCRDGGDLNLCALTWAQMSYVEKEGDSDGNE